ncbi:unnamed protein product [Darwinula stevensoni]|uniref:Metal-dependent HD superfamily phosphohydrolase n=1 Tax=Darwinula stevensoni TaxID=69355 RepID=A0A7R8X331_9CRUS|nr:unnamed protein product [Darwinula stevensoni]CAG0883952.1 unnamed protein product [Darwinula stevensoni]
MGEGVEISSSLREKWDSLKSEISSEEIMDKWWNILLTHYEDESRHYHTFTHIHHLFQLMEEHDDKISNREAVSFAIFFHDIIYNPQAGDNEEQSADKFHLFAEEAGIEKDSALYKQVTELIRLTATHMTEEHTAEWTFGTEDKHYFLDMDMAVLGSSPEEYLKYAANICKEYAFLPQDAYQKLRAKVLRVFLKIPNIYATREFRKRFEKQARKNIEAEIVSLES